MKAKKNELKVDYIGGQGPLTLAEEEAITQYLIKGKGKSIKTGKQSKSQPGKVSKPGA